MSIEAIATALFLLFVVNGAPIIVTRFIGHRLDWPVDFGLVVWDGRRLFGTSKRWRGVVAGIAAGTLAAPLAGVEFLHGAAFAALVIIGDLMAAFTKRRLAIPSSGRGVGIDQIPESLLPVAVMSDILQLDGYGITVVVLSFFVLEQWVSPILYRWHIRQQPW
jgi:hypothetical protein